MEPTALLAPSIELVLRNCYDIAHCGFQVEPRSYHSQDCENLIGDQLVNGRSTLGCTVVKLSAGRERPPYGAVSDLDFPTRVRVTRRPLSPTTSNTFSVADMGLCLSTTSRLLSTKRTEQNTISNSSLVKQQTYVSSCMLTKL
jgi:hypothetical protein